jgi:transcriptional regulator with XRE-family HTH domain
MNPGKDTYIGNKIRRIRKKRDLTLKDLSKLSNCSINYLSQVERGLSSPTWETLMKLTSAFGLDLVDFLVENNIEESPIVIRRLQRKTFSVNISGCTYEVLSDVDNQHIQDAFLIRLEPGVSTNKIPYAHSRPGKEFLYILSGRLDLVINGKKIVLFPGDSTSINSGEPHYLENNNTSLTEVISVSAPPRS